MGKKKSSNRPTHLMKPLVSVCTPTFNRRPFIPTLIKCLKNQDYPRDKIEWIIVDDGTDPIEDLVKDMEQVKYIKLEKKLVLSEKRNLMHKHATGEIIVYMDDDDYYPPMRISHAVDMLMKHPSALCAGASEMYIFFKDLGKMIQCGPYGDKHATAATFAFRKKMLEDHHYADNQALAEEKAFLKNYSVPFVQLEPKKTILVFSHIHNSYDKKKLLDNPHPKYIRESDKTVDDFVCESDIKKFFMEDIDKELDSYEPGLPINKPDVLAAQARLEEERRKHVEKMMIETQKEREAIITLECEGRKMPLNKQQVLEILQKQQEEIQKLSLEITNKNNLIEILQDKLHKLNQPMGEETIMLQINDVN